MDIEIVTLFAILTLLSGTLLIITLLSYRRYKNRGLLLVSMVFLFFLIRGILLTLKLFNDTIKSFTSSDYIWIFDLVILILLYASYSTKR